MRLHNKGSYIKLMKLKRQVTAVTCVLRCGGEGKGRGGLPMASQHSGRRKNSSRFHKLMGKRFSLNGNAAITVP